MLKGALRFETGKTTGGMLLRPFEILEIIARRTVFQDIDIEPMPKGWKVTCRGKDCSVTATGFSEEDVAAKIVNQIWVEPGKQYEAM